MKKLVRNTRRAVTVGAAALALALCLLTTHFISNVKTQLWQQSINTILESTRQGRSTLAVQLDENYADLRNIADVWQTIRHPIPPLSTHCFVKSTRWKATSI